MSEAFDVEALRTQFPIFDRQEKGRPIAYLDNAATTHKPREVLKAIQGFYEQHNANINRAAHLLSQEASLAYEQARCTVARFLNAPSEREVVFVRGATEGINLVAHSFVRPRLKAGDEILLTLTEHHSNIVPWQLLAEETGARLQVVSVDARGELIQEEVQQKLTKKTKLFGLVHVSNAIGVVHPVKELVAQAQHAGVPVLVDGAQSAAHMDIDVQDLGADFFVFSGHKTFGPTGIGVLWAKAEHLDSMRPYEGGGGMIEQVTFEGTRFKAPPERFEAGTPHISGAIGLAAALRFLKAQATPCARAHQEHILRALVEGLRSLEGITLLGDPVHRAGVATFTVKGIHAHDVDTILDYRSGVAVRSGHHCTQPLMKHFGVTSSVRASVTLYNTQDDIQRLLEGLQAVQKQFRA